MRLPGRNRPGLKASDVGLEFLTGALKGSHGPSGIVFTVPAAMAGIERECISDRTLQGHEPARKRGKAIGGAGAMRVLREPDEQAVVSTGA
ncbi:hypothetical protein AB0D13_23805 [Streptomyces sp. NPDC048430]|uniref:hypothetical protein n=1 Tax=Streptomyces sp. NPDC048430 TaxID=3155388 RepID=UPI00343466B0